MIRGLCDIVLPTKLIVIRSLENEFSCNIERKDLEYCSIDLLFIFLSDKYLVWCFYSIIFVNVKDWHIASSGNFTYKEGIQTLEVYQIHSSVIVSNRLCKHKYKVFTLFYFLHRIKERIHDWPCLQSLEPRAKQKTS